MSRFEANLSVLSAELDLKTIEVRLGYRSDASGVSVGDWSRFRADHTFPWSIWRMKLEWSLDSHPGTEGLDRSVAELSLNLAYAISELVSEGCEARLAVLQELAEDSDGWDRGFHLGVNALTWLTRARVSIVIDQYVLSEE